MSAPTSLRHWKSVYSMVSWAGIGLNTLLWCSLLFAAFAFTAAFDIVALPITWVQLCGELLGLVTIFYIPPALNVDRYRPYAWIGIISRASSFLLAVIGVLSLGAPKAFLVVAVLDGLIGGWQFYLLRQIVKAERLAPDPGQTDFLPPPEKKPYDPGAAAFWTRVYRWLAVVGIIANALFFAPLLFATDWMLRMLGVDGQPPAFAQFAGLLLGLISVFYLPGTADPTKYRLYAWLAIIPSRLCGVLMCLSAVVWLGGPENFVLGVFLDLPFAVAQVFVLGALNRAQNGPGPVQQRSCRRKWGREIIAVVSAMSVLGTIGWHKLLREEPEVLADQSFEERFKHGSIGTEDAAGLPYWIWLSLPNIFPEYLPAQNGYASLGFPWEPGAELPVGFTRKRIGFDRVGFNCALCHTGTVKIPGEALPTVHVGGTGVTQDILGYQRFLFACAKDPRFEPATILGEIDRQTRLSVLDRVLYKSLLIPATRKALIKQANDFKWTEEPDRPNWGPGRIEPFNPVKVSMLQAIDPHVSVGATLGTSDMMPLWMQKRKPGQGYHWDGLQTDLGEVVLSSALGDGATMKSAPTKWLKELQDTIEKLSPPRWPFRKPDPAQVKVGAQVFMQHCNHCHGPEGEATGQITPASVVGTDRRRAEMWTEAAAAAYNRFPGKGGVFSHFRSTGGYLNVPLTGLWTRAPYLHNGSVPTLADLLEPQEKRPKTFTRGLPEYDPDKVGYVWDPASTEGRGFLYDTALPGNSNHGHTGEKYGTELTPTEKQALIDYLKTL
jgi:cytochrome c5